MNGPILVVGVSTHLTPTEAAEVRRELEQRIGIEALIITACTALTVIPGDTE